MWVSWEVMSDMKRVIKNCHGFTLIEILIVVAIIGILAAFIIPRIMAKPEEARRIKAVVDIKSIETGLNMYHIDNGVFPTSEQGLNALVNIPTTGNIPKRWREYGYLPRIPKDPWGGDYIYLSPGANSPYDLSSYGPDGQRGGEGKDADITNWEIQ